MRVPLKETLIAGTCVAILCGLGTWQVQRLHWKDGIIERLNAKYDAAAKAPLLDDKDLALLAMEKDPMDYGTIEARLLRDQSVLLGPRMEGGRSGFHLLVPAVTDNGRTLIVNAGWVNDLWQDNREDRMATLPGEPVTLRGILHKPDWSSMASKNSPANDMWFRADVNEIAAAKGLKDPYPFILYADHAAPELYDVKLHEERWLPRNKHLQYALFWYALGMVMLGVYGFYVFGINKKSA